MESVKEELMQWNDFYLQVTEREGPNMALFYTCIAANVPFVIADIPTKITDGADTWDKYTSKLISEGDDKRGARDAEWLDGVTDIRFAFGAELTQTDFAAAIRSEKAKLAKLPGTKTQRKKWGERGNGKPFKTDDYNRMDEMFDAYASDYKASGLTQRREQALIRFVKLTHLADKAAEDGDNKTAQGFIRSADAILAGEAMRAKDEKPMEGFRFDACIVALEKAGLMEDGHFLSYEDTCKAIWNIVHPEGNPRYGYSLDVADQILLNWENNMRLNSGRSEAYSLPPDMKTFDDYGEFEPEETEEEKTLKRQMDLTKVRFSKGDAENADGI